MCEVQVQHGLQDLLQQQRLQLRAEEAAQLRQFRSRLAEVEEQLAANKRAAAAADQDSWMSKTVSRLCRRQSCTRPTKKSISTLRWSVGTCRRQLVWCCAIRQCCVLWRLLRSPDLVLLCSWLCERSWRAPRRLLSSWMPWPGWRRTRRHSCGCSSGHRRTTGSTSFGE